MTFERMVIEDWFDKYQFEVETNIGESGVKWITAGDLGLDLSSIPLRYGHHRGDPELRELIASEYQGLTSDHVAVTTGSSEAIFSLIASLTSDDDEIIIELPNYPSHYAVAGSLDRQFKYFELVFEQEFKPDLELLESLFSPNTKLLSLTHPNNPTGSVISTEELEKIIKIVEAHDAYLLVDETYRELSYQDAPPPAASMSPRAISVTTMSKTFGAPGIRIGWAAVADKSIIDKIRAVREQITICNSSISERIAIEILNRKGDLLPVAKRGLMDNLEILQTWMDEQFHLEWIPPAAGVVAFPRLKKQESADLLCERLINEYSTFTVPGSCFEMPRHFRVGFGGSSLELTKGLENLGIALNGL